VASIERPPAGLDPVVDWMHPRFEAFPAVGDGHVFVEPDGLGQAVWTRVKVDRRRGWTLYAGRGRDRQGLVDALLVAQSEGRIVIHPSRHGDAMRKALLTYRRAVGEDGAIGGELVVALALTVFGRRPPVARVY
jgi:hypothetical protein